MAKGLQELVAHTVGTIQRPKEERDKKVQKYVQYFMRILSSRIQGHTGHGSESQTSQDHILQAVYMKIQAQNRGPSVNKRLSRFETLNMKFDRSPVITKKNEVLRFLLEMAGEGMEK